ncbi:RCC1-like G exchanging factor-like protein [Venturia canescens]|uniref:RCC1-like G exchanging factor-like protein n=2 Tax=Venturia canescens TaxID=32260 RepID=UPI001C9CA177|nr:RCC1-like G exchanging factor-like protein [Venturia canescens]
MDLIKKPIIEEIRSLINNIVFQYATSQEDYRRVYVWGLAEHGALGTLGKTRIVDDVAYIGKPSRLYFGEKHKVVDDIGCGYGFFMFGVNSDDRKIVYGNGINTDSQIGKYDSDEQYTAGIIPVPRPIHLPLKSLSLKVLGLAAGRAHSLILTSEGVFTLGNNGYGQCGRPIIGNEEYAQSRVVHHIPNVKGENITGVAASQDHSILLTEKGRVYTFGWGADGQTALAHYKNEWQPSLVKGDLTGQHITRLACIADCVLAFSDKGKVFGWGNSEYGQLPGKGDNHEINITTELVIPSEVGHVVDIPAGGSFCMLLNSTGNVYVWGYGILGFGPEVLTVDKPTLIPPTLFGANPYDKNLKVSKICCGISHLGAVTNTGDLYMWGRNKFGFLGLGNRNDQFFPLKVAIGAQVKIVACRVDHTVTLCKPFI